jgi:hypothetical protein
MLSLGALAFLNPWLLAALVALPALWWLLRATPPSPRRVRFPGVRLLLGLVDAERTPERTPWWLLLLRCLIAAAAILAFAQPVLNPRARLAGDGPILLVMDGGWADAPEWEARRDRALELLGQAETAGRPVAFAVVARPTQGEARLGLRPAAAWRPEVEALEPAPWAPDRAAFAALLAAAPEAAQIAETVWLTDGLAHDPDGARAMADALAALGRLSVIAAEAPAPALRAPGVADGKLAATALRATADGEEAMTVTAFGASDETGARRLGVATARFEAGATEAEATFDLPLELRNRVERVALAASPSAGAVALADEGVRRRRAGLVSGGSDGEGLQLVSDLHYLRAALNDAAETVEGDIAAVLDRSPDVLFLADVGRFTETEADALRDWVESGGLLVRFAGPRLARGADALAARAPGAGPAADPLLPVRLRAGGRAVGGAMAWGAPQRVRPFPEASPFHGLPVPEDVSVSRQILAEIGPELPDRTWAALDDGTPLVTSAPIGAGRVALFHVTANAEWSSLPLSGLFVDMVGRLLQLGGGGGPADRAALAGRTARPFLTLDGFGRLSEAPETPGLPVERLDAPPGPDAPPGLWLAGETALAFNLHGPEATLAPLPAAPAGAARETLGGAGETPLAPWLLALAVLLLALDTVATLILSGRLRPPGRGARGAGTAALLALGLALGGADPAAAQAPAADDRAVAATARTVLAHVLTGDAEVDRMAAAGLDGLSRILTARTAIEPGPPIGVDVERDEIAFFPLLYWPITPRQPALSAEAAARLNAFMRTGGMIVFDTRDRHLDVGGGSPAAEALRRVAGGLDLPPLEPVPRDHVLTRAFYLLEEFPGRHAGGRVWVETTPPVDPEAGPDEAQLRNANDGVSPVIVGQADWAAAWAVDEQGAFLAPIAGGAGWRQREMAYRFGVNLVMYAMTGNYKSDQVHVPALLERLGQ